MNNQKLREVDIRFAIMKLKLTPVQKLVLLAILQKVDWSTFAGLVSSSDVSETLNQNRRSVRRAITELKELGYITRSSHKLESKLNSKAKTQIIISKLIDRDDMTHRDEVTDRDDMTHRDDMTVPIGTTRPFSRDDMTDNSIIQSNINIIKGDDTSLPKARAEKRLVLNEIKSIEAEIKRRGLDDTFDNRKIVARMLFKIELRKGGYYETI